MARGLLTMSYIYHNSWVHHVIGSCSTSAETCGQPITHNTHIRHMQIIGAHPIPACSACSEPPVLYTALSPIYMQGIGEPSTQHQGPLHEDFGAEAMCLCEV